MGQTASTSVSVLRENLTLSVSSGGATASTASAGSKRRVVTRGTVGGGARSGRVRILLRRYDRRLGRWVKSRTAFASVDRKGRYRTTVSLSAGSWQAQASYSGKLRTDSAVVPFKVR